jgi:hypothetical protein
MRHLTVLMLSILPLACSQSDGDTGTERPTLEPPKEGFGFQLAMEGVVEPYSEAWLSLSPPHYQNGIRQLD